MRYTITATRWARGWELHIDGVGVTQCTTLAGADEMVRDYLALDDHQDAATAELTYRIIVDGTEVDAEAVRRRQAAAVAEAAAAADAARALARQLRAQGLSVADTAAVMHVSKGRVSQLVA